MCEPKYFGKIICEAFNILFLSPKILFIICFILGCIYLIVNDFKYIIICLLSIIIIYTYYIIYKDVFKNDNIR